MQKKRQLLFASCLHFVHFACFLLRSYTKKHEKASGEARKSGAEGATLKLVL
jgi:hypothetical protein